MSHIQKLDSLSACLEIPLNRIFYLAENSSNLYRGKLLSKTDGKTRNINVPSPELKGIQKKLLNNFFSKISVSPYAFGWVKKRSRVDCVKIHTSKKFVYTADISNCFPTIHSSRVYKLLNKKLGCSPSVARLITKLTTYKYQLPQGAPTSPIIVNILLKEFDQELHNYFLKKSAIYSRFGDDIIVSSNIQIPHFVQFISDVIKRFGLISNYKKIKSMNSTRRQKVLGIVVNEKINIPREEINLLNTILYKARFENIEKMNTHNHPNFKAFLAGKIAEVNAINPKIGKKFLIRFSKLT